jgi:uncharacterized DUF497 family protein
LRRGPDFLDADRLTCVFTVATVKDANRVRSCQGRSESIEARRVPELGAPHDDWLGVSELDWEAALVWVDVRFEYAELRLIALVPKTRILYCVAFVDRGEVRRVISLRRANRREVKHYAQSI